MSAPSFNPRAIAEPAAPPTLDALYREQARTVARWVAHLGGPSIDVEDVVHEIFLIVKRHLADFRREAKVTTWLYRITERVVRDARRKERFRSWIRSTKKDQLQAALTSLPPDAAEQLERRQSLARVYGALDAMPEKYRQLLILFELEEMSGEDIATLTGIRLPTVWVRLHRARERFRAEMKALQEESP